MQRKLTVGMRLGLLVGVLVVMMAGIGYAGMRGMEFSNARLKATYEDRTVALIYLGKVNEYMLRTRHRMVMTAAASSLAEVEAAQQGDASRRVDPQELERVYGHFPDAGRTAVGCAVHGGVERLAGCARCHYPEGARRQA